MENTETGLSLVNIIQEFFDDNDLPYILQDGGPAGNVGIKALHGRTPWLGWVHDTDISSYWNYEVIRLNVSDPDFFPMLEFWLAFNEAMWYEQAN